MKKHLFAALLAGAMILSLAACGGGNAGGSASSNPGSGSDVSAIAPDGSVSTPDGSQPDASTPDSGSASGGASSAEGIEVTITLNKTEVKLAKAGATFRLRYTAEPDTDGIPSFTSSDTKVATVAEDGTIKAVAPGRATITVTYDGATATALVLCDWKEETVEKPDASKPSEPEKPVEPEKPTEPEKPAASQVDLQAFYDATIGKYEFGFLELADDSLMEQLYPGMSGVSAEQKLIYITMMSMNNGEFGLVQVKDAKDVDTVKGIFQARISSMVGDEDNPGNAWYPSAIEQWANNSRVVSNGNYVMMIVHENCDDIVSDFNALF